MGNSHDPRHYERYADFCARSGWHNKNVAKHQKIMKFFEKFDIHSGSIYYLVDELNLKQKRMLDLLKVNQVVYVLREDMFDNHYLCFLTPKLFEEFITVDPRKRDELFKTIDFKTSAAHIRLSNQLYRGPGGPKFYSCKYDLMGSCWWYGEYTNLTEDRRKFIEQLYKLGFANRYQEHHQEYVTEIFLVYCTEEQKNIFLTGCQPSSDLHGMEKEILQQHGT